MGRWNGLPQDLLLRVTRGLECDDIQALGCTCAAWKAAISANVHDVSFVWAGRRQLDKAGATPLVSPVCGLLSKEPEQVTDPCTLRADSTCRWRGDRHLL